MASSVDHKVVIQHIVNGTLADNLCLICLMPLDELSEHILTKICKGDKEYCIADVFEQLFQIQFSETSQHKVCSGCFITASAAFKFYLSAKRSQEILNFYTNELQQNMDFIDTDLQNSEDSICISLPMFIPSTEAYDYDLEGLAVQSSRDNVDDLSEDNRDCNAPFSVSKTLKHPAVNEVPKVEVKTEIDAEQLAIITGEDGRPSFLRQDDDGTYNVVTQEDEKRYKKMFGCTDSNEVVSKPVADDTEKAEIDADQVVIIMGEDGKPSFLKQDDDGTYNVVTQEDEKRYMKMFGYTKRKMVGYTGRKMFGYTEKTEKVKQRRKRGPMSYLFCRQCPVKYRFVAKLKEHMKSEHNIDLFICQVCKATTEDEHEYMNHLKTHTNTHTCAICNMVFKKRETIIAHLKKHEAEVQKTTHGSHVCEMCGLVLADEKDLRQHHDKKHDKKYTCYYCGKMYKGEISFDRHIKKHEMHLQMKQSSESSKQPKPTKPEVKKRDKKFHCDLCGGSFMDERALMWHTRLHTNERPHICEICGRGFVSVNRRNQHAVCAHSAPSRRCPLCPALFHLRSMVNTHIKKVHLKAHKRRNRTSKYQQVFWRTSPVPIQELSVSIQNEILELQAQQANDSRNTQPWLL